MEFFWSNPMALWLSGLLLLPILAHLIQRAPRNTIPFGAMMLLSRLKRVKRRHRQLSDWLLLLVFGTTGFGFGRDNTAEYDGLSYEWKYSSAAICLCVG